MKLYYSSTAANEDFELTTPVINLSPWDLPKGFVLSIRNDTILENNETFLLTLKISEPDDPSITIFDQETIQLEIVDDDGNCYSLVIRCSLPPLIIIIIV